MLARLGGKSAVKVGGVAAGAAIDGGMAAYDYYKAKNAGATPEQLKEIRNRGMMRTAMGGLGTVGGGALGAWAFGAGAIPGAIGGNLAMTHATDWAMDKYYGHDMPTADSIKDMPMNAAPEVAPATPPPPPTGVTGTPQGAPGAGGTTQTAALVSGAQGTDIMLMTRIPIAQAFAANMDLASKYGVASPTGH